MNNSIVYTPKITVNCEYQVNQSKKTNPQQPKRTSDNNDLYISNNPEQNLKNGLKSGDVQYIKPTTILWGAVTLRREFYLYKCNGRESIGDIKKKFGIPDGVIFELNRIKDDDFRPDAGKEIAFRCEK